MVLPYFGCRRILVVFLIATVGNYNIETELTVSNKSTQNLHIGKTSVVSSYCLVKEQLPFGVETKK